MTTQGIAPEGGVAVCAELERLRESGRRLRRMLRESRRKAQEFAASDRREAPRNGSRVADYEAYLERKLVRIDSEIERHVLDHGCNELDSF